MPTLRVSATGLLLNLPSSPLQPLLACLQLLQLARKAHLVGGRASRIQKRTEKGGRRRATMGKTLFQKKGR